MSSKSSLLSLFEEHTPFERHLRTGVTVIILSYVLLSSTVFESSYPKRLVHLYAYPWFRLMLVALVAIGAWWCPRVGLALALAVFFYFHDMDLLTSRTPKPSTDPVRL
jgi:hypothetical protein